MTPDSRLDDIMGLELLLDLPPGSHRDPWNKGGVAPRWPVTEPRPIECTGEILGTYDYDGKTGEFAYTPKITDEQGNVRDGVRQIIFPAMHDAQQ